MNKIVMLVLTILVVVWTFQITGNTYAGSVYWPCPQDNPNCHTQTTSSTNNNGSIVPFASEEAKKDYCKSTTNAWTYTCKSSYSCESLFTTDHAAARKCNRDRCIADKGLTSSPWTDLNSNSCNCKYWVQWVGATWIPLNTSIPFVGRCVPKSSWSTDDGSALNAFPVIISAATKMLVTVILLVSFVMIVVGGVQWASWDAKSWKAKITKVAIGIAMLGMMGAILRLINPNFFK